MKYQALVETAVLGQGLSSLGDDLLIGGWLRSFRNQPVAAAWMKNGKVHLGSINDFVEIRFRDNMQRIDGKSYQLAVQEKASGFLTAGGTMMAAAEKGINMVVSCGIGGIGPDGTICSDLIQLTESKVRLIATAPKDVVAAQPVMDYLHQHGVKVFGAETDVTDGFLFAGEAVKLDGVYKLGVDLPPECRLVLNPIPLEKRLEDKSMYEKTLQVADEKAKAGGHFHIEFNKALSEESSGISDLIQASSLYANMRLALAMANSKNN